MGRDKDSSSSSCISSSSSSATSCSLQTVCCCSDLLTAGCKKVRFIGKEQSYELLWWLRTAAAACRHQLTGAVAQVSNVQLKTPD